MNNKNTISWSP